MAKSVLEAYPDSDVSVTIVWESMLGSDTEAAARQSSAIFDDPRVRQFWDPNRRSGITFSRDVFPNMLRDTAASVPDDMPFLQGLKDRAKAPPGSAPLWDVVFLYEKGATWKDRPPKPDHWTKQVAFFGGRTDGTTGLFWRDDFAKPPLESDWYEELTLEMKKLTGKQPTTTTARAEVPTAAESGNSNRARAESSNPPDVTSLASSIEPLREWFNANKDRPRFITLLSPT